MKPILFYTVGYPGAGKTTLASRLAMLLGGEHLRGDKIGLELFRFPTFSPEERRMVHAEMGRRAGERLRAGRPVMYDAATNTRAQREHAVAIAQQHGAVPVGLWVDTPTKTAMQRAGKARDAGIVGPVVRVIPPHVFQQYVAAFEAPAPDEFILRLRGDVPFYLQYRQLQRQLHAYGVRLPRLIQ